ncbi:MAG: hypothetical protein IPP99_14635 [Chitinophagaceae bacterium]|nr:hypothetical protein [Chitinophagaceae bacterium]
MPFAWRILIFCCLACNFTTAQNIQYSRHLVKDPQADGMQLVANVDGYHHLLSFNRGGKPVIDLFNQQLRYISRQEIDITIHEKTKTSILPFKNITCSIFSTRDQQHTASLKYREMESTEILLPVSWVILFNRETLSAC